MEGDIPELREPRRELRWRGVAPEAPGPQRGGAGHQGVVEHVDGCAELPPQGGAPRGFHVPSSRDGSCSSPQAHPSLPDESLFYCLGAEKARVGSTCINAACRTSWGMA